MKGDAEISWICEQLKPLAGKEGGVQDVSKLDWELVYELSVSQRLAALMGSRSRESKDIPERIRAEWWSDYQLSSREALARIHGFQRLVELLKEGPEFIILKGWTLIGSLYHTVGERPSWDLDIWYLTRHDAEAAQAILLDAGYKSGTHTNDSHHHLPALHHASEDLVVELHTDWSPKAMDQEVKQDIWQRKKQFRFGGHNLYRLDPFAEVAQACIHLLNDPVDSPVVRNAFEIAWRVNQISGNQHDNLRNMIDAWGFSPEVARSLNLAHEWFDSPYIFVPRPISGWEFWARRRRVLPVELNAIQRFQKAVGEAHVTGLLRGRNPRNAFWPIWHAFLIVAGYGLVRLGRKIRSLFRRKLQRTKVDYRQVGEAVVIHDATAGEAHMLHGNALVIWKALKEPVAVKNVKAELDSKLVKQLVRKGLVEYR